MIDRLKGPASLDLTSLTPDTSDSRIPGRLPAAREALGAEKLAFNEKAANMEGVTVLNITAHLPFAFKRFRGGNGLENVDCLSTFRRSSFATDYGLEVTDGPLKGLCSRTVVVLDAYNEVLRAEQVPEIAHEPDYAAALAALG